jgi:CRISPR-associated endonuclease/helicase Cas3
MLLWAKLRKIGEPNWHPLFFHSMDCGAVCGELFDRMQPGMCKIIANQLGTTVDQARRIIVAYGALHDLGKATPYFQCRDTDRCKQLSEVQLRQSGSQTINHGLGTFWFLSEQPLVGLVNPKDSPTLQQLALLCASHHGRIYRAIDVKRAGGNFGDEHWKDAREKLVYALRDAGFGAEDYDNINSDIRPAVAAIIAGLISVADWLASSDNFPFTAPGQHANYSEQAKVRAKACLDHEGWGYPPKWQAESFSARFDYLKSNLSTFSPNSLQRRLCEVSDAGCGPSLTIIEAPMGCGKTEAALYEAACAISKGFSRGFYMALPTMATSNAMWGRIQEFLRHQRGTANFTLVHGQAVLKEDYRRTVVTAGSWDIGDDTRDGISNVGAQEWFTSKKRALLADFGTGTIDQIMLAALQNKHWFVRMFGLAGKTVIFDEIHACDEYMSAIVERLVSWLAACQCNIIMLSATLTEAQRREIVNAYFSGTGEKLRS